ncbi:hypothetical protein PHYSODRAFT_250260 [Phytophthora sojae]|uniref:ATP-dependent DNA helicase n=1 Tax=Phytophthora sojae (strain P6497) TaxID=1094619 RepID=G4ZMG7_PHYSP|nr:hypothetical protein PHYSODRAFT_250260 [Phytophthora sojae]EGZ15020.1 hypothetical protein PHYSODRAFT_250260 [Phytophthora sojae]|eukprot:XP_009528769.1 hypothetical protein PHYSODRAFT_250260 [Phytophthora sojae]
MVRVIAGSFAFAAALAGAAAHSPAYIYKFDAADTAGVDGAIHVKYAGEDSTTATITAELDFSSVDQSAIQAFDGNCTEAVTSYKWHIHTNYAADPLVCEKGDLSGKFGAFSLGEYAAVSEEWTDEHFPLPSESSPTWSVVLHAVCGTQTPRIACAVIQEVALEYEEGSASEHEDASKEDDGSGEQQEEHHDDYAEEETEQQEEEHQDGYAEGETEQQTTDGYTDEHEEEQTGEYEHTGESLLLRRTRAAPRSALARAFATSEHALDAAYRQLLELDASDALTVTDAQSTAVNMATRGYSVFLHLPTGAGKSLAFQAPALVTAADQTTLVVSPLIALMHDQVAALKRKGVKAIQVSGDERNKAVPLTQLLDGQRLVYTTPEFLQMNAEMRRWVRAARKEARLARIVLDEAHCVLEWGNTFRPAYLELCHWKTQHLSDVPVTLATASVSDEDIERLAELFNLTLVTDRENLRMEVVRKTSKAAEYIAKRVGKETTIVYCMTRKEAEDACLALVRVGCHAGVYHGGLPRKRREFVRKQWMMGQLTIICATSAFGMGIDRSDVRFVVHHSTPLSLSAYSQQIGRSGRDGKPAVCVLLYSEADKSRADALTTERLDLDGTGAGAMSNGSSRGELEDVAAFCKTTTGCRKELLYAHFGFRFDTSRCVRNCNCGVPLEAASDSWHDEEVELEKAPSGMKAEEEDAIPKGTIEYQYQKILAESKRLKLPKREALSRRLVRDVLEAEPASEEEMASMRGIGPAKAERYFRLFRFN